MTRAATPADVLSGAARWCVVEGDSAEVLRGLPYACVDAVVTDPPAGINFMSLEFDRDRGGRAQWVAWLAEVLGYARAATRDGGRALVWSLPRTSHWTGCAVEDAGWSIESTVTHLFGCLTPDTEILVNGDWVSYDKATAGNLALCYDAERDSLAWQPISELVVYDHHQHLFRLVGDRTDQLVTRGHRVAVYRDGRVVFLPADEVAESGTAEVPVVEDVQGMLAALPLPQRARGSLEGVRGGVPSNAAAVEAEEGEADLRDVRGDVHAEGKQAACLVPVLLGRVLREVARSNPGDNRAHARAGTQGQSGLDERVSGLVPREDDRPAQPCMEGRRHAGEFQGELPAWRVRSLPAGVLCDGPSGRMDSRAQADDGAGHRSNAHDSGERASRQSQPAGQPTGEPDAVREQLGSQAVRASRFASPDLVRVEPAHHDGIVWCVRVPTGAFVARRNGKVFITGNTGWPKGKSQLKPAAETWWLARTGRSTALNIEACRVGASKRVPGGAPSQAPNNVYGKASPRHEDEDGHNPSIGRYPPNVVLSHAPGCALEGVRKVPCNNAPRNNAYASLNTYGSGIPRVVPVGFGDPDGTETVDAWRCVEGCPVRELDAQSGERPSGAMAAGTPRRNLGSYSGGFDASHGTTTDIEASTGGAARFFPQFPADEAALFGYHAKPSRAERDAGVSLDASTERRFAHKRCSLCGKQDVNMPGSACVCASPQWVPAEVVDPLRNNHPTVKSIALMRWLVRLVSRPGALVLDPFGGSGTTGAAALSEGRRVILVERDPRFAEIARQRCEHAAGSVGARQLSLLGGVS